MKINRQSVWVMITLRKILIEMQKWLFIGSLIFLVSKALGQNVRLHIFEDAAYFLEQQDSILVYRASAVSFDNGFSRSNYIHPLYNLNGSVITQDFPEDHRHHRGIFWAWHQLLVGNTCVGDGWEIKNMRWEVISMKEVSAEPEKAVKLKSSVLWKSSLWKSPEGIEKPLVVETTTIAVHPKTAHYRIIDFEIELLAMEREMKLGGSKDEKGYGGFSLRTQLPEDIFFEDNQGEVVPQNLPIKGNGWLSIAGSMDNSGKITQLVVIPHKGNPGYPNPWILRSRSSMQNAVYPDPGAIPVLLSIEQPTVLKYRVVLADGSLLEETIEKLQSSFFVKK